MARLVLGPLLALALAGCLGAPASLPPEAAALPGLVALAPGIVTAKDNPEVEAAVAGDPLDPWHIAVFHIERTRPYLTGNGLLEPRTPGLIAEAVAVSRDGGATWGEDRRLPQLGTAAPGSLWGTFCSMADPNAFFDDAGVLHIVTLALSCSAPGYLLATHEAVVHATSGDDGASWSEPDLIWVSAGGTAVWAHDRQWSAYDADTGAMLAVWTTFHGLQRSALTAAGSTDGGRTWTLAEEIEVDPQGQNWLVHALAAGDGTWRITGFGCPDANFLGRCLWVYRGAPGQGWERSEASLDACGAPAEGGVDYAIAAVDPEANMMWAASGVTAGFLGAPIGTCVFASHDRGATWPTARWLPAHDHPWIARAPDGRLALASLQVSEEGLATPAIALLAPHSLETTTWALLGEAYDLDVEDDGVYERAHYDVMAAAGDTFVWALTRPNAEGRGFDGSSMDLDIWAYRAALAESSGQTTRA